MNGRKTKQKNSIYSALQGAGPVDRQLCEGDRLLTDLPPILTLGVFRVWPFVCLYLMPPISTLISLSLVRWDLRAGQSISPSGNCCFTNNSYVMLKYFIPIKNNICHFFVASIMYLPWIWNLLPIDVWGDQTKLKVWIGSCLLAAGGQSGVQLVCDNIMKPSMRTRLLLSRGELSVQAYTGSSVCFSVVDTVAHLNFLFKTRMDNSRFAMLASITALLKFCTLVKIYSLY